ncbi:hypothetical protein Bpfe_006305 [Biomphalaria pfeifferi]|uniref:Endonuclease/exonuclease/phosphatase domain-containing protein n=1 Tax=Biomphalaria pfeifferi TaxID=112525 RepID=A0AAD8C0R4_BIOPF|nr:hypothetical protein Bpfe_006305 [Biomphalaria pfeifferi]
MFNWRVRVQHIAELIKENEIDIMAFQEVRQTVLKTYPATSQLDEFKSLLPEFKWTFSRVAGEVSKPLNSYWYEWNKEGLGILSRKQIIASTVINFTSVGQTDTNPRIALHAKIRLDPSTFVNVIVVHFSYDRHQQCSNAEELMSYISTLELFNVIILGDFNAYTDFPGPMDMFTSKRQSSCFIKRYPNLSYLIGTFKDAWISFDNHGSTGFTFSNMPEPGLVNRPDRIIISKNLTVKQISVIGNGLAYKNNLYTSVLRNRALTVIQTSYDSFMGRHGYSCFHDCGPHGSCRCGVCIHGGNKLNCNIPDCNECTSWVFLLFLFFVVSFCVAVVTLFYSVVKALVVSSRFNQELVWDILGYRCCLFNKGLFLKIDIVPRKYKSKMASFFVICRLPPFVLMFLMSIYLFSLLCFFNVIFNDSINLIYSVLPEEMFPSDHLMFFTKLSL